MDKVDNLFLPVVNVRICKKKLNGLGPLQNVKTWLGEPSKKTYILSGHVCKGL